MLLIIASPKIIQTAVAVLGFQKDEYRATEGSSVAIMVGVSEGFLDLMVNVTFYTTSGTAQGSYRQN